MSSKPGLDATKKLPGGRMRRFLFGNRAGELDQRGEFALGRDSMNHVTPRPAFLGDAVEIPVGRQNRSSPGGEYHGFAGIDELDEGRESVHGVHVIRAAAIGGAVKVAIGRAEQRRNRLDAVEWDRRSFTCAEVRVSVRRRRGPLL